MAQDYVRAARELDLHDLQQMAAKLMARVEIEGWPAGRAFEHLILRAFEISGAEVAYPYVVRQGSAILEQIDGSVTTDRVSAIVESKDYRDGVDYTSITKLKSQLARRPAGVIGCVFSMNGFTKQAKVLTRFGQPLNVLLWDGSEIEQILADSADAPQAPILALHRKYRHAVEMAEPDYNISRGYLE